MYGTSIEKAASSSISLWANLSHGRGWDVGGRLCDGAEEGTEGGGLVSITMRATAALPLTTL